MFCNQSKGPQNCVIRLNASEIQNKISQIAQTFPWSYAIAWCIDAATGTIIGSRKGCNSSPYTADALPEFERFLGAVYQQQNYLWLNTVNYHYIMPQQSILLQQAGIQTMLCIPSEDGVVELGSYHHLEEDEIIIDCIKNFFHTSDMEDFSYGDSKSQMQICEESIQGDDLLKVTNLVQILSQGYATESSSAYAMAHDYHFDGDIHETEMDTTDSSAVETPQKGAFQPWIRSQILPSISDIKSQYMLKYILEASSRCNIAPLICTEPQRSHKLAERRRRARQGYYMEKLKCLIPRNTKKDKISILESAIDYIPKLQRKVRHLEQENRRMEMAMHQVKEEKCEALSRDIEVSNIEGSNELQIRCLLSAKSNKLVGILLALQNMSLEVRNLFAQPHQDFLYVKLTASPLPSQMQVLSCVQVRAALHNVLS